MVIAQGFFEAIVIGLIWKGLSCPSLCASPYRTLLYEITLIGVELLIIPTLSFCMIQKNLLLSLFT